MNTKIKFRDLDIEYQNHFIKNYVIAALFAFFFIVFSLLSHRYIYIIFILSATLLFSLYQSWLIYKSLTDQVYVYDLTCVDIERKNITLLSVKDIYNTCHLTLKSDNDMNVVQPVPYSSSFNIGDIIRIYAEKDSLSKINNNTYTILNPIFIYTLQSK